MSGIRLLTSLFIGIVCCGTISCGGDGGTNPNPTPKVPARVALSPSGPDTLALGATGQLSATVYAADNSTLSNSTVTYASTNSTIATVNSSGLVTAGLLGGRTTITASAGGISSNPVTVIVYDHTLVGVPANIVKVQDVVGSPVVATSVPVKVKVTDVYGDAISGTSVTFTVTHGNGTVVPASTVTDNTGMLGATWTVGTSINTPQTAVAATGSLQAVFDCTLTPGSPVAVSMLAPYYGVTVGTTLSFSLLAKDVYGNLANAAASFVSRNPSVLAFQSHDTPYRDSFSTPATGQTYVVGSVSGLSDSTLVTVFQPNGVLVSAQAPRFDLRTDTTFSTKVQLLSGPTTPGVGSVTVTVTWDPTVLTYVNDVADNNGPSATVNSTHAANGSLTIAVATSTSLSNNVSLRDITFKAASIAGRNGTITVTVPDISDNNFTSLLPVTRTLSFPVRTR